MSELAPRETVAGPTPDETITGDATRDAGPGPHEPGKKGERGKKRRAKRRAAKGLAWFALVCTVALVLSEPWLLVPAAAMLIAISLWD